MLKTRLDDAGKKQGRNLSQEAELRLENSFRDADALDQAMTLAYGPTLAVALATIGRAVLEISRFAPFPQSWLDRPDLGKEMGWVSGVAFAALQGRARLQDDRIMLGPNVIGAILDAIKHPERAEPELRRWGQPLHEKLGPEGVARLCVPPWVRHQIGADGTLIGAQLIDGDTVTDLTVTAVPPGRPLRLRFKVDNPEQNELPKEGGQPGSTAADKPEQGEP
jgi:hypothetical protein